MEVPDCAVLTPGLPSRPRRWSPKEHSAFDGAESGSTAHRSAGSGPPIPKRLAYFDKRPFQKSPFENVRFLGMAVYRQCHKVFLQKVLAFENQLVKTSHCDLNDMIYNS